MLIYLSLLKKLLQKVKPHYKQKVKVLWAKINSWDNEAAQIKIDGKLVWERRFQWHESYFGKVCGAPVFEWKVLFARTEVDVDHTGEQAKVEFTSTFDEAPNNESFGLRDLYIFYSACAKNCDECTGPKESDCKMGVGASATKTFDNLPHKRLRLQSTIYKIDSWDGEFMIIKVDGAEVWKTSWNLQTGVANICGCGIFWDGITGVDEIFNHQAPNAEIVFTSTLDQDASDESWGFRDFQFQYEPKEAQSSTVNAISKELHLNFVPNHQISKMIIFSHKLDPLKYHHKEE